MDLIIIIILSKLLNQGFMDTEQKIIGSSVEINVQGQSSPEYALHVTLTSKSTEPVTLYEYSLPWKGWYSILLVAVKTDAQGTPIDKSFPIDDPGPARITIEPGETLTGKISLISRFPGFLEALKDWDIIVFWSYQLQPIDAAPLQRVGGYVLFPKLPKYE
jgi:hypothetical protein